MPINSLHLKRFFLFSVCFLTLLLLLVGCAAPQKTVEPGIWPAPPNYPRIQFLMGVNNSNDVEKQNNSFNLIGGLVGAQETVRPILKPYGIAEHNGVLYVVDTTGNRVVIIDIPKGSFSFLKGNAAMGKLKKPVTVAVDKDGFIYVADTERREVLAYSPSGEFSGAFCRDFDIKPVGVAVYEDQLYVLDMQKSEVVVLNKRDGTRLSSFGRSDIPGQFLSLPTNMAVDHKGVLHITNVGTGQVISFDRDGHFLKAFGEFGTGFGQASRPRGITVDKDNITYVVDAGFQLVQMFNEQDRLLMSFGGATAPLGGMNLPAGIVTFDTNLDFYQKFAQPNFKLERIIAVTNQFATFGATGPKFHKVALYGLGKMTNLDYDKEYRLIRERQERQAQEFRDRKAKEEAELKKKEEAARKLEEEHKQKELERIKKEEEAEAARRAQEPAAQPTTVTPPALAAP